MMALKRIRIRSFETGLIFHQGEFNRVLGTGTHWVFSFLGRTRVVVFDRRRAWFRHPELDQVVRCGALDDQAEFLDLTDHQRALIWIDGRFQGIASPGLHGLWKGPCKTRYEMVDVKQRHFTHPDLDVILAEMGASDDLRSELVAEGHVGVVLQANHEPEVIPAGRHAFWKDTGPYEIKSLDTRETAQDVTGQKILTADKVTVRLNALVTAQVVDPKLAVGTSSHPWQALHRDVQMALRAVIGTRTLDQVLAEKDQLVAELAEMTIDQAAQMGIKVLRVGIRDVILPGEMKELMNRVIQARKVAEANLIQRREEVAAIRSQANTARIMEGNPTLMRLKELEVLQSVANNSRLEVILGEKGLADRVINLL
jgi:SPFH domain / Band 7 family